MKPYWKITVWYLLFGLLWIFFSDRLLGLLVPNVKLLNSIQTLKGWFYVGISGLLIFQLTKRAFDEHETREKEKLEIFKTTVRGTHHILLNYLNQMQLVVLEAERSKDFDADVIEISREISEDAAAALMDLVEIEKVTSQNIDGIVHGPRLKTSSSSHLEDR